MNCLLVSKDIVDLAAVYPAGSITVTERYIGGLGADEWVVIYTGSGMAAPGPSAENPKSLVIALTDATGAAISTLAY